MCALQTPAQGATADRRGTESVQDLCTRHTAVSALASACYNMLQVVHGILLLILYQLSKKFFPPRKPYNKCDHCGVTVETNGVGALFLW